MKSKKRTGQYGDRTRDMEYVPSWFLVNTGIAKHTFSLWYIPKRIWSYIVMTQRRIHSPVYDRHEDSIRRKQVTIANQSIYSEWIFYSSCQWLGVRRCFSPGTPVSSTSYTWLVNNKPQYGRKSNEKRNSKFSKFFHSSEWGRYGN